MGSLCAGTPATTTSNSTSSVTPTALPQIQSIYNTIANAASTPYTPYTGQIAAGLSPTQQSGIANTNAAVGTAQPYIDTAAGYAATGASPISASQIQNYSNPYTQSVIDSTQAQFNNQNQQQAQQLKGNAISQGAFGGDRAGVAQAELANQQQLAQAPVIAGLNNQNYTQALGAAQADRSAAQTGAQTFAGLGTTAQNAALQGAQGQLAAGSVEQGTTQNQLTSDYQQYLNAQAFPYQQAQFLATLGLPAATAQGSTTTGSGSATQTPAYNPFSQAVGLGTAALTAFSDKRMKTSAKVVGKLFDGQKIYKFQYKGDPRFHIGLMAQDVEKKRPHAVGERGGFKTVNYDMATEDAAERGHFASGGSVTPFNFITDSGGYVPKVGNAPSGQIATPQLLDPSSAFKSTGAQDTSGKDLVNFGAAAFKAFGNSGNSPLSLAAPGIDGSQYASPISPGVPMNDGLPLIRASGGRVNALLDSVNRIHAGLSRGGMAYAAGGEVTPFDRISSAFDEVGNPTPDPATYNRVQDVGSFMIPPDQDYGPAAGHMADIPTPRSRPDDAPTMIADAPTVAPANPMRADLPPIMQGAQEQPLPDSAMAYSARPDVSPMVATGMPQTSQGAPQSNFGSFNPFGISDKVRSAIISGALGMAYGRSGNALTNLAQGAQQGFNTFGEANLAEQARAVKERELGQGDTKIKLEAQRLDQALQHQKSMDNRENLVPIGTNENGFPVYLNKRDGKEVVGSMKLQGKAPSGYVRNVDGTMSPVKGGPADPEILRSVAAAKQGAPLPDETADLLAERVLAGDGKALVGLGRGAQGAANISKIQTIVAQKAKERGMDASDILAKTAEQSGLTAQQRTFGTQVAKMAINATEAQGAIKLGREASALVPRGTWVPINKAVQAYQAGTSDPMLAKFGAANLAIINTYARAISPTGVPTVNDKEHAEKLLSTATGPAAYNAVLDQMDAEINIAHAAPSKAKKELEDLRKGRASEPGSTQAAPVASPKVGEEKQFKQGVGVWDGTKWVPKVQQ